MAGWLNMNAPWRKTDVGLFWRCGISASRTAGAVGEGGGWGERGLLSLWGGGGGGRGELGGWGGGGLGGGGGVGVRKGPFGLGGVGASPRQWAHYWRRDLAGRIGCASNGGGGATPHSRGRRIHHFPGAFA